VIHNNFIALAKDGLRQGCMDQLTWELAFDQVECDLRIRPATTYQRHGHRESLAKPRALCTQDTEDVVWQIWPRWL
jgi:hypothetical protein